MSKINNLKLWEAVEKTNPKYTKPFSGKGGFKGTAISANYQIKTATEQWGSYGQTWGLKETKFEVLNVSNEPRESILCLYASFYYPDGSFEIATEIDLFNYSYKYKSWAKNNDVHKKVTTDAITKSLSMLGFNADVFMGKFDDNKYMSQMSDEFQSQMSDEFQRKEQTTRAKDIERVSRQMDAVDVLDAKAWTSLMKVWNANASLIKSAKLTPLFKIRFDQIKANVKDLIDKSTDKKKLQADYKKNDWVQIKDLENHYQTKLKSF